ncbi:MAG: aspartate--tRNA(Asn) ligase, partial [Lachnospiraceae bacterium]|nr:aspartate--tRNA(Asn) ligase [Lachnospiraceae bacterium]
MDRIQIKDVKNYAGQEVLVKGFAENWRDGKSMAFLVLKDITGKVQVTIEKELHPDWADELAKITLDSVVFVTGTVQLSDFVKLNGVEIIPTSIKVDSIAAPL